MKLITFFLFSLVILVLTACDKEDCVDPQTVTKTLYLRPGPADGQDTKLEYNVVTQTGNETLGTPGGIDLPAATWTNNGNLVYVRTFIKFTGLSGLPAGSDIVSAKLSFYGNSSYLTSPQGNSTYPGSPYSGYVDNSCWLQRIMSDWAPTTITWNNQPATTTLNQTELGASNLQFNYNVLDIDVTRMVRDMTANSNQNFGFCLKLKNETIYRNMIFNSSEFSDSTRRPRLVVSYKIVE